MATFKCLYKDIVDKGRDKKLYKLSKAKEKNIQDNDLVKYIKDGEADYW